MAASHRAAGALPGSEVTAEQPGEAPSPLRRDPCSASRSASAMRSSSANASARASDATRAAVATARDRAAAAASPARSAAAADSCLGVPPHPSPKTDSDPRAPFPLVRRTGQLPLCADAGVVARTRAWGRRRRSEGGVRIGQFLQNVFLCLDWVVDWRTRAGRE